MFFWRETSTYTQTGNIIIFLIMVL